MYLFLITGYLNASPGYGKHIFYHSVNEMSEPVLGYQNDNGILSKEINRLNKSLYNLLIRQDFIVSRLMVDSIIQKISKNSIDSTTLSDSYYYIGVYYSFTKNFTKAINYLKLSLALKEKNQDFNKQDARALYNLGALYGTLGDFKQHEIYSTKSLDIEKRILGESSPDLISTYSSLITAYLELQEYDKSLNFANIALNIANKNLEVANSSDLANLYSNLGVLHINLADFTKAKIFLEKSESIYRESHLDLNESFINLMNNMAITYGSLGLADKSNEYYEKGIALALSNNSAIAYNIINSYAIILGDTGKKKKGEALLSGALIKAKTQFGENSRGYFLVLINYADYLRIYNIDKNRALRYYVMCMDYLRKNDQDIYLKTSVHIGYSLSLNDAGESERALETIQSLLFSEDDRKLQYGLFDNPSIGSIISDKKSLNTLKTKYEIVWNMYRNLPDQKTLEAASNTSELIISLLEKLRININEEESRLVLGDRYRDAYLKAIRDFDLLYSNTSDRQYLEKAFEYSEKSKVAGLLTSTRELKAAQFSIPSDIADLEKKLQRDISLFNGRIAEETVKGEPDTTLIINWKENLLASSRKRDSLILVFEKQYPDYYALKYNTQVAKLNEVPDIMGRNGNYINYIVSDTVLYIFVVNRKYQQLIAMPVDSSFYNKIKQFRNLLSMPSRTQNAKIAFENYQSIGYELFNTLISPVRKYLISDKIIISPDNILSYLPFETIPTSPDSGERFSYRELHYLMNDFDISYTYSATFMAESEKRDYRFGNKAIAFAPNYPEPIDIQSELINRQGEMGVFADLPYARQEAEYVANITGGKLFENDEAKESVYKTEAGKFDIIHLAMHTFLNDKDPMNSTLIFSPENDTTEDCYLKTYEVYGIPLKAKMVVLSSCNTGTGLLYTGEGILSLARGFIYSGSQSVVMSMWEIDDNSGTDIIKMFYKNLKKGYSKNVALKKARITWLKTSDQLRSHPYFWSTLVIYGNNSPLYYSKYLIIATVIVVLIIVFSLAFYYRKRKYS